MPRLRDELFLGVLRRYPVARRDDVFGPASSFWPPIAELKAALEAVPVLAATRRAKVKVSFGQGGRHERPGPVLEPGFRRPHLRGHPGRQVVKALFFHATGGTKYPKVLGALEGQTWTTSRPFNRFLGQAIHTAKQRQFRYQLPWERVRNLLTIRLEPADTLLRVPRRLPGVVLADWPVGTPHDFGQMGFVVNRRIPVRLEAATLAEDGLLVRTEPPLHPTE